MVFRLPERRFDQRTAHEVIALLNQLLGALTGLLGGLTGGLGGVGG